MTRASGPTNRYPWLSAIAPVQPLHSRAGGLALMFAAPILAIIATVAAGFLSYQYFLFISSQRDSVLIMPLIFAIMALFIWCAAIQLIQTGRRIAQPAGIGILERDPRPPIILLCPMPDARRSAHDSKQPSALQSAAINLFTFDKSHAAFEAALARAFDQVGPLIVMERSTKRIAPLGAPRLNVPDEHWRTTVTALAQAAAVIALQLDKADSASWELQYLAASVDPRRILLLVPNPAIRPLGYAQVRELISSVWPAAMPDRIAACDALMFDGTGGARAVEFTTPPGVAPFVDQVRALSGSRSSAP